MGELERLVDKLTSTKDKDEIITELQDINALLLTKLVIKVGCYIVEPLWVEAYYNTDFLKGSNDKEEKNGKFVDLYCHRKEKQADNFGKLYFHESGRGGVDICLSKGNYYLSFLIKFSRVTQNGKNIYEDNSMVKQVELYDVLCNEYNSNECQLQLREKKNSIVFNSPRIGLSYKDEESKYFQEAYLASFTEIRNKGYYFVKGHGKEQTIKDYFDGNSQITDKRDFCINTLGMSYFPKNC